MADGLRITDPRALRALAHPARIEIVEYLNSTGASVTATECAGMVDLSPSATSYHLRELAKYGMVEQAPSAGDGRERRWRSTSTGVRIDADLDEPKAAAAAQALVDLFLERDMGRVRAWSARQPAEPVEWRDSSALMSHKLLATAEELNQLNEQVAALLEPYKMRGRQHDAPAGARAVHVNYMAFPE